jgi:hypothetical protein
MPEENGEVLSAEEAEALMPMMAKWRQELSSIDDQLKSLTERKAKLTGLLAALSAVLPPKDDSGPKAAAAAPAPEPRGVTPSAVTTETEASHGQKKFTPVEAYWRPMLEALVERGGRAHRDEVVELVGKKMEGQLTPDDKKLLPSGIDVRWKNRVAWQRENMKRRGLVRSDSPQGIWEITDTGREWLQERSFQIVFFTLAALRIGNLSGPQFHPVTMGGYRNFVRQYAQEFGDPVLGEVDDHLLTDPIVMLWRDGSMELKKYDPVKNEWWDFSELQREVRRLVGRGDWHMRLTEKGRALLVQVEETMKKKKRPISK